MQTAIHTQGSKQFIAVMACWLPFATEPSPPPGISAKKVHNCSWPAKAWSPAKTEQSILQLSREIISMHNKPCIEGAVRIRCPKLLSRNTAFWLVVWRCGFWFVLQMLAHSLLSSGKIWKMQTTSRWCRGFVLWSHVVWFVLRIASKSTLSRRTSGDVDFCFDKHQRFPNRAWWRPGASFGGCKCVASLHPPSLPRS